jgi:Flp pilus assembly protein TadG
MRRLISLLDRFRRDEGGAFAMIFAALAIVLIAMAGATVDFTEMQQARTRAQVALDAAALALQPAIYTDTIPNIQKEAQDLLANRLADGVTTWAVCNATTPVPPCATVITPVRNTADGTLTLTANLVVPMNFVSMLGVKSMTAQIMATSTRKKLALEVAMVLDNSGSMATAFGTGTRMTILQASAKCATNIIFYGNGATNPSDCTQLVASPPAPSTQVKMSIVPFTMEVNVGTANANATWLDRTGLSATDSITLDNFDTDDNPTNTGATAVDRIALFSKIKDPSGHLVPWGGCVEARRSPYDTQNTTPTTGDTLFTPFFAPDEPDSGSGFTNNYLSDTGGLCTAAPSCVAVYTKSSCSTSTYNNCGSTAALAYTLTVKGVVTHPASCSYVTDQVSSNDTSSGSGSTRIDTRTISYASYRAQQERVCKYQTANSSTFVTMTSAPSFSGAHGPNSDCPTNTPITPPTATPATITTAINAMSPVGGTNITEGAAWGFRTLSPGDPFNASAFSNATSKNLILMTDGANTTYTYSNGQNPDVAGTTPNMNGETYDSAYGFPWNNDKNNTGSPQRGRLGAMGWPDVSTSGGSSLEGTMNTRLLTICTNAKTAGITIYTIGVDTANSMTAGTDGVTTAQATALSAANKTLLTSCASSPDNAYFPLTAADLQTAFVNIANQLAALRLSQ